jgi:outer membrane protein TolC
VDDAPKFDLSQRLPFPGKLRLRGEIALGEAEAASHDYAAVRLRIATMASLLFDEYYLVARSLQINAEHIALLEDFQRIATVRYEVGEAAQQDPIQAEVELSHAVHRDIVFESARRVTREQINALLHRHPDRELPPPPARVAAAPADSAPPHELIAQALQARPELAAAGARVAAEEARVGLAWREYFPDFTVAGSYNQLWQEEDLQPFVGIQLNVPLRLDRRKAAVEEADARLEQARSRLAAVEDEVRLGVESGAERLGEAGHVVKLFRDRLLPAARDHVAAARSGFETGRNSFLALIDAERNLRNVELGHEQALADLGRRRAELDRAVGRIPGLSW